MATVKVMTVEDLWDLEDDGCRYELIRGELVSMVPTGEAHAHLMGRLSHLIWGYLDDHPSRYSLLAIPAT